MKTSEFNQHVHNFENMLMKMVPDVFKEQGGINPVVFAIAEDQNTKEVSFAVLEGLGEMFMEGPAGKEMAVEAIKTTLADHIKPMAMAFVSEAWTVRIDKDEVDGHTDKRGNLKIAPKDHPDKVEMLFIAMETHSTENMISWEIGSEEEGRALTPMIESEWVDKNENSKRGRMSDFLKENYVDIVADPGDANLA